MTSELDERDDPTTATMINEDDSNFTTTIQTTTEDAALIIWLAACQDYFEELNRKEGLGLTSDDFQCACFVHCPEVDEYVLLSYTEIYFTLPTAPSYTTELNIYQHETCSRLFYERFHLSRQMWSYIYYRWCHYYDFDYSDPDIFNTWAEAMSVTVYRDERKQALLTGFTIYLSLTLILGIVGNVVVIISVYAVLRKSSVTNIYIGNLAIIDLVAVMVCTPVRFLEVYELKPVTIDRYPVACRVYQACYYAAYFVSIFIIVTMALERYIVIVYPMKAKSISTPSRARKVMIFVWMLGFLATVPSVVNLVSYSCNYNIFDAWARSMFFYQLIVGYIIPLFFLTIAYGRVATILHASIKTATQLTSGGGKGSNSASSDAIQRMQVVRMLIALVITFALFWGPMVMVRLMHAYHKEWFATYNGIRDRDFVAIFFSLGITGCAINPYVYALFSRQYRQAFRYVFTLGKYKIDDGMDSSVSGRTTVTGISSTVATTNQA